MTWPPPEDPSSDRWRTMAGQIGWGLLFALAAILLFVRMLNGGGC